VRALFLLAVLPLAADTVLLRSGQTLQASRVERFGTQMRLIVGEGTIEIDAAHVLSVEPSPEPAPPAAVPAPLPTPAAQPAPNSPEHLLRDAARRHGLPADFVLSVARAESGFQPAAISPKGAIGLMQLMPATARQLNADPHDPRQNVEAGVKLLKQLLLQYDQDGALALAAYNAGPGAVARHKGVPPYRETTQYVDRILRWYLKSAAQPASKP
jgi:soluble lytic murein transglycosylase-like protein